METEVRSFVLRDPCTQKPLRRTRYRLFNNAEPGFLVMGKTNRKGETVEVKVSKGEEIHLIPVVGQGRYGRAFVLEFEKTDTPVAQQKYRIIMANGKVTHGYSDTQGNTKYVTADEPENLHLEGMGAAEQNGARYPSNGPGLRCPIVHGII